MRQFSRAATGAVLVAGLSFGASPAAAQQAACDSYGRTCPTVPGDEFTGGGGGFTGGGGGGGGGGFTGGGGGVTEAGGGAGSGTAGENTPSTLPFTGGEVVLLALLGAGAVAAGGALVVAARRRAPATA